MRCACFPQINDVTRPSRIGTAAYSRAGAARWVAHVPAVTLRLAGGLLPCARAFPTCHLANELMHLMILAASCSCPANVGAAAGLRAGAARWRPSMPSRLGPSRDVHPLVRTWLIGCHPGDEAHGVVPNRGRSTRSHAIAGLCASIAMLCKNNVPCAVVGSIYSLVQRCVAWRQFCSSLECFVLLQTQRARCCARSVVTFGMDREDPVGHCR